MHDVNWWLMALAFVLGLVLTLVLMIGRVTREVPVTHAVSAGLKGGGVKAPDVKAPDVKAPDVKVPDVKAPAVDVPDVKLSAAGAATAGAAAAAFAAGDFEEPYGKGSVRVTAGAAAPSGFDIKGNEDSMLYHTTESPWYKQTIAEVWFADEPSAQAAGFTRWDAKDRGTAIAGFADLPPGPYGKGSAKAGDGGAGPTGWTIKGNEDSMLYHTTESPWYQQTIAEVWFAEEEFATAAGFTRWDAKERGTAVASLADVPPGPYGKGSAKAGDGGSGPAGWLIKGNADSMLYHPPDSPAYNETIAEVWFFDEETAKAAGFDKWDKNFR
ncbi:hypothetical protein [Mycobacterium sp. M26]|uniref:channel accessory protein ArfC, sunset domain variant n=1 Tax=Mycobacterium sp. M26 TaxID=1762962 RepID=UPI00073EA614|nr:hypothetical protein [Mycobacterium sp. M26]